MTRHDLINAVVEAIAKLEDAYQEVYYLSNQLEADYEDDPAEFLTRRQRLDFEKFPDAVLADYASSIEEVASDIEDAQYKLEKRLGRSVMVLARRLKHEELMRS